MRRLTATFVAACMVIIAGSLGAVLFLAAGLPALPSALVALTVLCCLALYNVARRPRPPADLSDHIAALSRGSAELARDVAALGRRLASMEERLNAAANRERDGLDPLAAEIGELGGLIKQIAETVAAHDSQLRGHPVAQAVEEAGPLLLSAEDIVLETPTGDEGKPQPDVASGTGMAAGTGRFAGISREQVVAMIADAVDAQRIDLYLQPIVTLPQRRVRFYEAMSRLRTAEDEVIPAEEFIDYADGGGLTPKIDNLLLFRCVQVVRRLLHKNRDVGLFCNLGIATLSDPAFFRQFHDFMQANRALAPSLVFEFRQRAYRSFGAIEHEGLAAIAELGFRFSLDHVTDLRIEPRELFERGFRFLKLPARLLLDKDAAAQSNIDPTDLAPLLARSQIDLVVERIENEAMVVDLLDYNVQFGQGFLFSPPRPVRPEALQAAAPSSAAAPAAVPPSVRVPSRPAPDRRDPLPRGVPAA
ncbi:MAG TPA: EAL domain-containing protein [Pseudolabrys sp.]|nr:EAL domain-containing protein [Pseudolabrys sp.]